MTRLLLCACACATILICFQSSSQAALIVASDSAADAAYDGPGNWQPNDNGGFGWGGGWKFRNQNNVLLGEGAIPGPNSNRGWFVGSSLANNQPANSDSNGDGDINSPSPARAWGVYSNSTDQVYAIRPLGSAMQVGQTLKWDMDNGNIADGQVVGLRLLSNATDINTRLFEARFVGADSSGNYTIVGSPNQTSGIPFTREGLHLEYTLTGAATFSLKILRKQDGTTQTITGTNSAAGSITALAFKNQFAGSNAERNGYLNNISLSNANIASLVNDDTINNVMANDPNPLNNPVTHTFTATNLDFDTLTWSNFDFDSYLPAYGGAGPGPALAASFTPGTQAFSWNTTGSPRGIYKWKVDVSDGTATDTGYLEVHVTAVPEPTTVILGALALLGLAIVRRR